MWARDPLHAHERLLEGGDSMLDHVAGDVFELEKPSMKRLNAPYGLVITSSISH